MSGRRPAAPGDDRGQAAVETVAIAPLVAVVLIALVVALEAHRAGAAAGLAVHAAGIAALEGRDPGRAARTAAPDVPRERMAVKVRGGRITVRVRAAGPRVLVAPFDASRSVRVPSSGASR